MEQAGLSAAAIRAFEGSYSALCAGATGLIPESDIEPACDLPRAADLPPASCPELLQQTVVIKLNGGLGTSMGLEKAKSLLPVRGQETFLDLIARQILRLRRRSGGAYPAFLLMNSFNTSADTQAHLAQHHPNLGAPDELELLQNRVPKVLADTLAPLNWPANPHLEWCPPGHGDLYASLLGSGWLDRLLACGIRYAFVSNSDNLGAQLDEALLSWFAHSGHSFLMEVTRRTNADRKGGHLARRRDGRLLLRESAQCPKEDEESFQDINRHQFFNTNNLWLRLDRLKEELERHQGLIPLPIIVNRKTADPRDPSTPAVIQLETAMGAAIECFPDAAAIEVPRTRFAPVKNTSDLLAVRSDAYHLSEDLTLELHPDLQARPPHLHLDPARYKLIDGLDAAFPHGAPSLRQCRSLLIHGPIVCEAGVVFKGDVAIRNHTSEPVRLQSGTYEGELTFGAA